MGITQEKGLDREKSDQFELLLSAYDSNGNSVEKDDTLKFIVTDKNDNSPIFNEATLYQKVQEDVTKNTNVFGISATDLDSDDDDNNKVKYFKVPNSEKPTGNRFKVNTLGQVQVIGDLDAELVPKVTFEVYAKDNDGRDGGLQSPNQVVTVEILDANDHAPVFLNTPYKLLNLSELAIVGEKVFEFEATDADKGLNSMVTFKIKSGNDKGFFTIKSSSTGSGKSYGQVYLNNALDFESYQRSFHLTIVGYNANATNADVIDFQSETGLRIVVKDENEPPVFINGPYKSQIEENDLNKDLVPKIEVKDEDFGGQKVTLTLGNNDEGWFKINSDTGIVSTLKPLDREHKSVDSETSIYILQVIATDPMGLQSHLDYAVEILDVNDNAPMPFGNGWTATVCSAYPDEMTEVNVTRLTAQDFDSKTNGPPFKFSFPPNSIFDLETRDGVSVQVITTPTKLRRSGKNLYEEEITIIDATAPRLTGSGTLTVNVCRCNEGEIHCSNDQVSPGGFNFLILVAILAVLLIIIIIIAMLAISRNNKSGQEKDMLLYDEDDVRDGLQPYHDEGGGEEDNDNYELGVLQPMDIAALNRKMIPQAMQKSFDPDSNVEEYIENAMKQADSDPTAPPFDSLLVFDYEGQGSDAGSLSSINSGTTDGSQNYDYLNDWGPRFNKIADMYGGNDSE